MKKSNKKGSWFWLTKRPLIFCETLIEGVSLLYKAKELFISIQVNFIGKINTGQAGCS